MRAKQLSFDDKAFKKPGDCFGGSLVKGNNPKTKRPLESKLPIHLTLRSKKSVMRLPKNFRAVGLAIENTSKKYGVRIYERANVGNHLHMVIKIPSLQRWA